MYEIHIDGKQTGKCLENKDMAEGFCAVLKMFKENKDKKVEVIETSQ